MGTEYSSLKVWVECVCLESPWAHSGPVIKEGYRLDLLVPHIDPEGVFICQVINCEKLMSQFSRGRVELNVAIPSEYISLFFKGAKVRLKAGRYFLADCEIENFEVNKF